MFASRLRLHDVAADDGLRKLALDAAGEDDTEAGGWRMRLTSPLGLSCKFIRPLSMKHILVVMRETSSICGWCGDWPQ